MSAIVIEGGEEVTPNRNDQNTPKDSLSNTIVDPNLQDVTTAPDQVSDYIAAYMIWIAKLLGA